MEDIKSNEENVLQLEDIKTTNNMITIPKNEEDAYFRAETQKDNEIILRQEKINQQNFPPINFPEELKNIKQNGTTQYDWNNIKNYFIDYYKKVVETFPKELIDKGEEEDKERISNELPSNIDKEIIEYIINLNKMPFTLQRMAELIIEPNLYYKTAPKYNSAFKKLVNIEPD